MTEITIYRPISVAAKYLKVEAEVRYWEDASVNGQPEDDENPAVPCRSGSLWAPVIDLDAGSVVGWPGGTTADVHYKVCDAGRYALLDAARSEIIAIDGYVPSIMSPGGNGYGDYIIMSIGPDGRIGDWRVVLNEFQDAARKGGTQ